MENFVKKHVKGKNLKVLDVGGADVNGSYKPLFKNHDYKTLDWNKADFIVKGYEWPTELVNQFDIVISGQTLEHDAFFWKTLKNMASCLKVGGLLCIIVPSGGAIHRYPIDCYRFNPDCVPKWAEWMELNLVESSWNKKDTPWCDTVGIFKKGK